jgi:hypothetical protein
MRIRILKPLILEPGITAVPGQIFDDFPPARGTYLILQGDAEEWKPLPNPLPIPDVIEAREPAVENREPAPMPRVKRYKPKRSCA